MQLIRTFSVILVAQCVISLAAQECGPGTDAAVGDDCDCNTRCQGGTYCLKSDSEQLKCACLPCMQYDDDISQCVYPHEKPGIGERCIRTCRSNLACDNICQCPNGWVWAPSQDKCVPSSTRKLTTSPPSVATSPPSVATSPPSVATSPPIVATSPPSTQTPTTKRPSYRERCSEPGRCMTNLLCVNSFCACGKDQIWNAGLHLCVPDPTDRDGNPPSCVSSACPSNMKCGEDGKCHCPFGTHWDSRTRECMDNMDRDGNTPSCVSAPCPSNMKCGTNGKCLCPSGSHWDSRTRECIDNLDFNERCTDTSQCRSNLVCINNQCVCAIDRVWDAKLGECVLDKRTDRDFKDRCTQTSQCRSNLECINNQCVCAIDRIWDAKLGECVLDKRTDRDFKDRCTHTSQCRANLECINNQCVCAIDRIWDAKLGECVLDKRTDRDFKERCTHTSQCRSNLECTNNQCVCAIDRIWNAQLGECVIKSKIGTSCVDDSCVGFLNGDYQSCRHCEEGIFIKCSNGMRYVSDCALGYYKNESGRYLAKTVFNNFTKQCDWLSPTCPRDMDKDVEV